MKKITVIGLAALLLMGCKPTPAPGGGTGGGTGGGSGGTGDGGACDPTTAIVPCAEKMNSVTTDSVTTITIDTTKSEK